MYDWALYDSALYIRLGTVRLGTVRLGTARLGTARLGTAVRLCTIRLSAPGCLSMHDGEAVIPSYLEPLLFQAKLAKLRRELLEPTKGGGGAAGVGFDVSKVGDSRVGLVGGCPVLRALR
jgi:hypothetical protein